MPLEIRELIIRATVNQSGNTGGANNASGNSGKESQIDRIVEKVFEILKEKSER
ncbi:DUF5908 family protein [Aquimarina sp. MMG016]|uniref:DUF5908 family protein n=1 Tax=Aquimarina sp. MMG016 TaxID=2822690 RepID=UPI001B39F2F3|nr:DUF5908 family protein [Aquimarina sp. MMG016]MBQ4818583.1 hypothetical protein [Aquimarina sp. MMG016]